MDTEGLGNEGESSSRQAPHNPKWPWILLALVLVGFCGMVGYRLWIVRQVLEAPRPKPVAPVPAAPEAPKPAEAPLPPVGEADALVRGKLAGLSSSELWAKWLQSEDLSRRFASAVNAVADGESPRLSLGFLAPVGPFKVVTKKDHSFIDPECYRRYDGVADAFASLDAALAGKAFGALRPIFEAAYREIGRPGTTLDQRLGAAFDRLIATPVLAGDVEVVAPKAMWLYADPEVERLSAASKHLMRTGPRNQRLIQAKLAELRRELGLPGGGAP